MLCSTEDFNGKWFHVSHQVKINNSDDVPSIDFAYNMKDDWQRSVWGCSWITEITPHKKNNPQVDKFLLAKLQIPATWALPVPQ